MVKKNLIIAVIASFCLTATLFMIVPTRSQPAGKYDPWADINSDGIVDMKDIRYSAKLFGAEGDPTKLVVVENYNCSVHSYYANIPSKQEVSINIPTAGFKQITVGFASSQHVKVSTGFLIDSRYANVERFDVGYLITPHTPNAFWIEPENINLLSDVHEVGYKFNVTVWVNLTSNPTEYCHALQSEVVYDKTYLNATRAGLTFNSTKSGFFKDVDPTLAPEPMLNFAYNSTHNFVRNGEAAFECPGRRVPAYGSFAWIEFEVIALPPHGIQYETSFVFDEYFTYALDYNIEKISPMNLYSSVCTIEWNPPNLLEYDLVKTYNVIGPTLTIKCYNPNDLNIELMIEAYLTA